ncbi:MAG TPA: carbohydrate binding domain-containing protein [Polyangiaceae bacterium]|nr:carbohydrate binding domain-containing protein [Polyangiaceae bacterium]
MSGSSLRFWSRLAPLALLPGCLVSFNDYPLGELNDAARAGAGAGGGSNAGTGASSSSGGKSTAQGGSSAAGTEASTAGTSMTEGGAELGAAGAATVSGTDPNLIDDFEDGDERIVEVAGRSGSWYAGNDGKGMQTPANEQPLMPSLLNPARDDSRRAAHTFGGPFPTWGALIGTSLAASGNQAAPYDLSHHTGIKLWVRSGATSLYAAKQVRLNLPTPATNQPGICTVCNDHFGADIPLTSKWTQVTVPLSSLKQTGYGTPRLNAPDLKQVLSLQLLFPKGVSFDLWVDDIELY